MSSRGRGAAAGYIVTRILRHYPELEATAIQNWLHHSSFASVEKRFLLILVPKAACTSLKLLLRQIGGAADLVLFRERETQRGMFVHDRANVPFPPVTALPNEAQQYLLESGDVLRVTIVRNPYSRLVSVWRSKVLLCEPGSEWVYAAVRGAPPPIQGKEPLRFEEFVGFLERESTHVRNQHWRKQVHLTFPKAINYAHLGRCEQLSETLEVMSRHLRCAEPLTLPRVNESALRPPTGYSVALAARIHALFGEDFTAFGYDPELWPSEDHDTNWDDWWAGYRPIIDQLIERNLVINRLYDDRRRLEQEKARIYRFAPARLGDKLRSMMRCPGWQRPCR
jgi:sulfotransferase famil protein